MRFGRNEAVGARGRPLLIVLMVYYLEGAVMKAKRYIAILVLWLLCGLGAKSSYACDEGYCCCSTTGGAGGYACKTRDLCDAAGGTCYADSNCDDNKRWLFRALTKKPSFSKSRLVQFRSSLDSKPDPDLQ